VTFKDLQQKIKLMHSKAARPENDNPDWQAVASQLAINIYILKTQGIIAAINKKNIGPPFDFSSGPSFAPDALG
jgi:hypothetical protein